LAGKTRPQNDQLCVKLGVNVKRYTLTHNLYNFVEVSDYMHVSPQQFQFQSILYIDTLVPNMTYNVFGGMLNPTLLLLSATCVLLTQPLGDWAFSSGFGTYGTAFHLLSEIRRRSSFSD